MPTGEFRVALISNLFGVMGCLAGFIAFAL
jgi:hypothetical protein